MRHYRLVFSREDVLDEFEAESDGAAHRWGRDASRLVDVPTQVASDTPWRRSDFRVERRDGSRWVVIAGWVLARRPGSP